MFIRYGEGVRRPYSDLNGQSEEQGLMNTKTHRGLLDVFGNLHWHVKKVEKSWTEIAKLKKLLDTEYKKKDSVENIDFLEKSIKEIAELELDQVELDSIDARRDDLKKASRSNLGIADTFKNLNRDLVEESILNAIKSLEKLKQKYNGAQFVKQIMTGGNIINKQLHFITMYMILALFMSSFISQTAINFQVLMRLF